MKIVIVAIAVLVWSALLSYSLDLISAPSTTSVVIGIGILMALSLPVIWVFQRFFKQEGR